MDSITMQMFMDMKQRNEELEAELARKNAETKERYERLERLLEEERSRLGGDVSLFWKRALEVPVLAKGYVATLAQHSPFPAQTMGGLLDKQYHVFHADAQCGKSFAMGLMVCKLLSEGKVPVVVLNMPQKSTLVQLHKKFERLFYEQLGFGRSEVTLACDVFGGGGNLHVFAAAAQKQPTVIFASASAHNMHKLDEMLGAFPGLRGRAFMVTDEFHMFFTLTPDKKKAEVAVNRFMYGVDELSDGMQLGIAGIAFFSATELDLFFFLRERGVSPDNFDRFCIDEEKRCELVAHGYRTVTMMDVQKLTTKFDFSTAFGKAAEGVAFMTDATEDEPRCFDGSRFATMANTDTFAPQLLGFFRDWAATRGGLMIEMSTRLVDDEKLSSQTLGQHAAVVARMWPETVVMTESGGGISWVNGEDGCWPTFDVALALVHARSPGTPIYLITNCGYGSRTYSDLTTRRVTHMYVAFSDNLVNNILTKYQAITRGNGWFSPGDKKVKILITEDDWRAVRTLESLTERLFSTYPAVDTEEMNVYQRGIIADYSFAHGMNEPAKRCKSEIKRPTPKRSRTSMTINGELWMHHTWHGRSRPGSDPFDPLFVAACSPEMVRDVCPHGTLVTSGLHLIPASDTDREELALVFSEGSRRSGNTCHIYSSVKAVAGNAWILRTGCSNAQTFKVYNCNPQHIPVQQHNRSLWAFMTKHPSYVQALVRTVTQAETAAAEHVVFHTFVEDFKGVAVNFS
jgi:hypothetical protein